MGLSVGFLTIIVSALTGLSEKNRNETLHMTGVQASWLGISHYYLLTFIMLNDMHPF